MKACLSFLLSLFILSMTHVSFAIYLPMQLAQSTLSHQQGWEQSNNDADDEKEDQADTNQTEDEDNTNNNTDLNDEETYQSRISDVDLPDNTQVNVD